MLGNGSGSGA